MKIQRILRAGLFALAVMGIPAWAEEPKPVQLPPPQTDGGMPLMQALQKRASMREFNPEPLPPRILSNLLWAAYGINRPENGKRTAPSAMNKQEIDLYVSMATGLYQYDARANQLRTVSGEDIRSLCGKQPFVQNAPLNLILVADYDRMGGGSPEEKAAYSNADAAFIGQNVYLFCASEGLATVFRASIDKPALAKAMKLRENQKILYSQTVGYPKK